MYVLDCGGKRWADEMGKDGWRIDFVGEENRRYGYQLLLFN